MHLYENLSFNTDKFSWIWCNNSWILFEHPSLIYKTCKFWNNSYKSYIKILFYVSTKTLFFSILFGHKYHSTSNLKYKTLALANILWRHMETKPLHACTPLIDCDTGWPRSYRKYILQITQPSQYGYTKLQYRFAATSGSPSIIISHRYWWIVYPYLPEVKNFSLDESIDSWENQDRRPN